MSTPIPGEYPSPQPAAVARPAEVVSLDALAKQRHEALPEPTTFELRGVTFTLPPIKALPFELQEKIGDSGNNTGLLQTILGEQTLQAMYGAGYSFTDLELIMEEWQKRSGVEPGESPASAGS